MLQWHFDCPIMDWCGSHSHLHFLHWWLGAYPTKTDDFYCLTSGSKYKNLPYFIKFVYEFAVHSLPFCANSKYADEFQMNVPHDYIGTCLP